LASVVLPEPGNPHTMINLEPVPVLSISGLSLMNGLLVPGVFTREKSTEIYSVTSRNTALSDAAAAV